MNPQYSKGYRDIFVILSYFGLLYIPSYVILLGDSKSFNPRSHEYRYIVESRKFVYLFFLFVSNFITIFYTDHNNACLNHSLTIFTLYFIPNKYLKNNKKKKN